MRTEDYREQDDLMRSLMQEGTEEVPSHIWENISGRLDAGEHLAGTAKVHRPAWKRAVYITSSAAAAIAAGLILWNTSNDMKMVPEEPAVAMLQVQEKEPLTKAGGPENIMVEEIMKNNLQAEETTPERKTEEQATRPSSSIGNLTAEIQEEPAEVPEETTGIPEEPAVVPEETATVGKPAKKEEIQITGQELEAFFPEEEGQDHEKSGKGSGFSLTVSGNAGGNLSSSKKVPAYMHSSPALKPVRNGIYDKGNAHNALPMTFGISLRYNFTPRWAVSAGINYTLLNRSFNGDFYDEAHPFGIETRTKNIQHYIGVPVNFYYTIVQSKVVDFYVYAGGTVEKNVGNKYLLAELDNQIHTEKVKGVQWSAGLGLGVEFLVTRWLGIYIDPSLRYYFNNSQPTSIRTAQPLSIGAEIGLRARL